MAGIFNKIMDFVGLENEEAQAVGYNYDTYSGTDYSYGYDEQEYEQEAQPSAKKSSKNNKVISMVSQAQQRLVIYQPTDCRDSQNMIDNLCNRKPVIANLEGLDYDSAQRVVDIMSGALYALGGEVYTVSNAIYVFTPKNTDVTSNNTDVMRTKSSLND